MSVRGLVTVVIGVCINKIGALMEQSIGKITPLIQGSLNPLGHGNLELAEAYSFGQVQRLYTEHPIGMKKKSTPIGNYGRTCVAFVVIDSLKKLGGIIEQSIMGTPLIQGSL